MKTLIIAILMAVSASAFAENYNIKINGKKFPIDTLPEIRSESSGMSMDDFAFVVAQKLREYTDKNGYEACAMICKGTGGAWGVSPVTVRSHVACYPTTLCPSGTELTNVSIHSHPTVKTYKPKEVDKEILGSVSKSKPRGALQDMFKTPPSEDFSEKDYDGGPGYMVSATTLYFQEGKKTDRIVRKLNDIALDTKKPEPSTQTGRGSR